MIRQLLKIWTAGLLLLLCFGSDASSQVASIKSVPVSSQVKSDTRFVSLREALKNIEESHDINIMFQSVLVQDEMVKKEALSGEDVEQVLERILLPLGLTYVKVNDQDYVIKLEKATPKKLKKRSGKTLEDPKRVAENVTIPLGITQKKNK